MQARGDRIDAVPAECRPYVVEVFAIQLARIVELVVVHEVAEPLDGAMHLLCDRLVPMLRLVAAGNEARHHRAERPDTERSLHGVSPSTSSGSRDRAFG